MGADADEANGLGELSYSLAMARFYNYPVTYIGRI